MRNSRRDALRGRTALSAKGLRSCVRVGQALAEYLEQRKGMAYIKKCLKKYFSLKQMYKIVFLENNHRVFFQSSLVIECLCV